MITVCCLLKKGVFLQTKGPSVFFVFCYVFCPAVFNKVTVSGRITVKSIKPITNDLRLRGDKTILSKLCLEIVVH